MGRLMASVVAAPSHRAERAEEFPNIGSYRQRVHSSMRMFMQGSVQPGMEGEGENGDSIGKVGRLDFY